MDLYSLLSFMNPNNGGRNKKAKSKKSCLQCGKSHTHNNSFCSAKCHKAFHEPIDKQVEM